MLPRVRMANPGASAKRWCGGTPTRKNGQATTIPTSRKTRRRIIGHEKGAKGDDAIAGDKPFIMHPDGVGWIWVSSGLKDGPLPTHYEPLESIVTNPLYPEHSTNPAADKKERADNAYAFPAGDERFPYLLSTYRLTEHHTGGGMSRYLPHLAELQPELFAEISPQLGGRDRSDEPESFSPLPRCAAL